MIRKALIAAAATLLVAASAASPVWAQSTTQEALQERYDRALAAGYKALFLCSAIANAEIAGTKRTEQDVLDWELTGIQSPLDSIIGELSHTVFRYADGEGAVSHVTVEWDDGSPPRLAWHRENGGCAIAPIGTSARPAVERVYWRDSIYMWHERIPTNRAAAEVVSGAFEDTYGTGSRTTAVIVDAPGQPRLERYTDEFGPATPQRTWSVAKSLAATLVGVAVDRGEVDVGASAGLGESDSDPRRAITIDHALRMASGRYSDTPGNRTDPLYWGGATVDEVALDWPLVSAPGSVFRYANNDTLAAVQAIENTYDEHPPAAMFEAIGMHHTVAETDWQGNYILSSQVWSTAPDLLRLGQLYLNNGVTEDGTRILPENWLEYVSTPSGPQPDGPLGYGASWWLVNQSEGIPADTIAAIGNRGQFVIVVPSRDVVIVRRGEDPVGSRFDFISFTRDVLAALEE